MESNEIEILATEVETPATEEKVIKKVQKHGIVISGSLNLRRRANLKSGVLKVLPEGSKVKILSDEDDEFYKVSVDDLEGYCMKKFIKKVK